MIEEIGIHETPGINDERYFKDRRQERSEKNQTYNKKHLDYFAIPGSNLPTLLG